MNRQEFIKKWLETFVSDLSKSFYQKRIRNQYIWHVFSWEFLPKEAYLERQEAIDKFSKLNKSNVIVCYEDKVTDTITLNDLDEVYIVDKEWTWSYIQTHEKELGPYFIKRQ